MDEPANFFSRDIQDGGKDGNQPFDTQYMKDPSNYYQDAEQIPQDAVDAVATATKANIVVNHPNVKVLAPNQPLNRGAAAAIIYQTLVHQGKLPSIPSNTTAYNYIVHSVVK